MAFPTVESLTEQAFASATTDHNVTMPATVNSGDLLLVVFMQFGGTTITTPSGWTRIAAPGSIGGAVYAKSAAGTEGGTNVNFQTNTNASAAAHLYRMTGWHGTVSGGVEVGTPAESGAGSPDPSSTTPSWGSADTLWIAYGCCLDDDVAFTGYPTGFTNGDYVVSGAGTNAGCEVGTARKEDTSASLDPDSFTLASTEAWISGTIAVRPGSAGGGLAPSSLSLLGVGA